MVIEYNSEKISKALGDFYGAIGIDIDLLKPDFSYAIDTPLQNNRYCKLIQGTKTGNEQCKHSDRLLLNKCRETMKPQMHICHAGLIDVAFPIIYEESIIGYIVFGRMRPDTDFKSIEKYVASLGIDCKEASNLYSEIPVFDDKKIESISNIATMFVKYILLEDLLTLKANDSLQSAVSFIESNLERELSVKTISKATNISKSALYDKFHKNYGCTLNEYINKKRIEKAKTLLKNTDYSVDDIAGKTGFSSASYFSKCFKKQVGLSPLKYKKSARD